MNLLHRLGLGRGPTLTYWVCRCGYTNPAEFAACWQCGLGKVPNPRLPEQVVFKCLGCGSQFPKPASAWHRFLRCPDCGHPYLARMAVARCGHFVRVGARRCDVCGRGGPVAGAAEMTRGK